jgi:hypothetical protein
VMRTRIVSIVDLQGPYGEMVYCNCVRAAGRLENDGITKPLGLVQFAYVRLLTAIVEGTMMRLEEQCRMPHWCTCALKLGSTAVQHLSLLR